ncbi:TPM domain-containing protein [Mucilaginibacter litoreus]|uniref:TPM domain-containing protein n=1 Tax=Mucilaginibacter litoreus TaxID=1048221 RepID=A0ABW3AQ76_9SPHI
MKKILILFLALAVQVSAQVPKPKKQTFINDYSGVLSVNDIKTLNQKIYIIQKESDVQMAVVLVDEIPSAYNIKKFATAIGRQWHVGKNQRGLVYVAAIKQHTQRLEVAKNLRSIFTTKKTEAILSAMKSAYRKEDYAGGLKILVNKIHGTLAPQTEITPVESSVAETSTAVEKEKDSKVQNNNNGQKDEVQATVIGAIIWFGIILLIVIIYYRRKLKAQEKMFESMVRMSQSQPNIYNNLNDGSAVNAGYNDNTYRGYSRSVSNRRSSSAGSFITGAALGAAGGYGARYLQDKINEDHHKESEDNRQTTQDSFANSTITSDNNPNNWGNWNESGNDDDSGFSDDESESYNDSNSTDNSGFSDDTDDSSGSTSNW